MLDFNFNAFQMWLKSHFWQEMVQDSYSPISISATFGLEHPLNKRFCDLELRKLRMFTHNQDMQVFENVFSLFPASRQHRQSYIIFF